MAGGCSIEKTVPIMPRTRFQGSKRKLAGWIGDRLDRIGFDSVLDVFGGTGSMSFEFKRRGKSVTYNDVLKFNHQIGRALIENGSRELTSQQIEGVGLRRADADYPDFVERTFGGIYFTDAENRWLDAAVWNIRAIRDRHSRAVAWYALFQSALAKRPYNLFHRKNLYMREAAVPRSFGNKATWDKSFDAHFRSHAAEANRAVFDNGRPCRAVCGSAVDVEGAYDLVYIDPPYVNAKGVGVNYLHFYHFLEGLVGYGRWGGRIEWECKHLRFRAGDDPWTSAQRIGGAFDAVFSRFAESVIVVSYRSDGIPSIDDLVRALRRFKQRVRVHRFDTYQYALSKNVTSREVLIVGS